MSVFHERSALDRPVSLFEHAQRLHRRSPDGPLADGGHPFPDSGGHPDLPHQELRDFLDDPAREAREVREFFPERPPRLLEAARWLIENGTDQRAVLVGLGLLNGHAEPRDVPVIRVVGLLRYVDRLATAVLAKVPEAAHDLIWLVERTGRRTRDIAVKALAGHPDPAVRSWVRSAPRDWLSSALARQIAEQQGLAALLGQPAVDDLLWDQAGALLVAMTSTRNYRYEIGRYQDAVAVYQRWVALADRRTATVERAALLTTVAQDLATGPAAAVVGELRGDLVGRIKDVVATWTDLLRRRAEADDPVEARRAAWILDEATRNDVPQARFAVRVVVSDPNPVNFPRVEARIVIDGSPVIAAAFDRGPAEDPERLVDRGGLRAANEPREVRLAEAYCTEGCCGALYVTIVREGSEVVWKDWRSSTRDDPPGEFRFDAREYDREVARAEQDHGWEWPARTVARLVSEQWQADAAILGRWDCAPGWCTAWLRDYDTARLSFDHPADDPTVRFGLVVDVGNQDPDAVAADVIASMRNTDPKAVAEMIRGSADDAKRLGLVHTEPSRW
ncbi:MAG: hypothetical protein ABIQ18_33030 [Umezawaea sp.]